MNSHYPQQWSSHYNQPQQPEYPSYSSNSQQQQQQQQQQQRYTGYAQQAQTQQQHVQQQQQQQQQAPAVNGRTSGTGQRGVAGGSSAYHQPSILNTSLNSSLAGTTTSNNVAPTPTTSGAANASTNGYANGGNAASGGAGTGDTRGYPATSAQTQSAPSRAQGKKASTTTSTNPTTQSIPTTLAQAAASASGSTQSPSQAQTDQPPSKRKRGPNKKTLAATAAAMAQQAQAEAVANANAEADAEAQAEEVAGILAGGVSALAAVGLGALGGGGRHQGGGLSIGSTTMISTPSTLVTAAPHPPPIPQSQPEPTPAHLLSRIDLLNRSQSDLISYLHAELDRRRAWETSIQAEGEKRHGVILQLISGLAPVGPAGGRMKAEIRGMLDGMSGIGGGAGEGPGTDGDGHNANVQATPGSTGRIPPRFATSTPIGQTVASRAIGYPPTISSLANGHGSPSSLLLSGKKRSFAEIDGDATFDGSGPGAADASLDIADQTLDHGEGVVESAGVDVDERGVVYMSNNRGGSAVASKIPSVVRKTIYASMGLGNGKHTIPIFKPGDKPLGSREWRFGNLRFDWEKTSKRSPHNALMKKIVLAHIAALRNSYQTIPDSDFDPGRLDLVYDQAFTTWRMKYLNKKQGKKSQSIVGGADGGENGGGSAGVGGGGSDRGDENDETSELREAERQLMEDSARLDAHRVD